MDKCPKCGHPLDKFYSGAGGKTFIACTNLSGCNYKKEI